MTGYYAQVAEMFREWAPLLRITHDQRCWLCGDIKDGISCFTGDEARALNVPECRAIRETRPEVVR